jgi:hypothetical protein
MKKWRIRVSIPVPLECKSSALPSELIPLENVESQLVLISVAMKIDVTLKEKINICFTKMSKWRIRVSIPVPLECESSALPSELIPLENVQL